MPASSLSVGAWGPSLRRDEPPSTSADGAFGCPRTRLAKRVDGKAGHHGGCGPVNPRRLLRSVLGLVAFALVTTGCVSKDAPLDWLRPQGPIARDIGNLWTIVFYAAVAVFFLVEGAIVFALIRFRHRKGDDTMPKQTHGNTRLEVAWTIIPALLLAALAVPTLSGIIALAKERPERSAHRRHRPPVVVALRVPGAEGHHRERAAHPDRTPDPPLSALRGHHPQLLGPGPRREAGRRPATREPAHDRGRPPRGVPRDVCGVLRTVPREHAPARLRPQPRRLRAMGGLANGSACEPGRWRSPRGARPSSNRSSASAATRSAGRKPQGRRRPTSRTSRAGGGSPVTSSSATRANLRKWLADAPATQAGIEDAGRHLGDGSDERRHHGTDRIPAIAALETW